MPSSSIEVEKVRAWSGRAAERQTHFRFALHRCRKRVTGSSGGSSFLGGDVSAPLVAPHDIDGLFFTVAPGNRHGLLGATRHIRPVGRYDLRWKSMYPVPGDIIRVGVMDIARWRLPNISQGASQGASIGFAIGWVVEEAPV